jgi:hypothetical protein
VGALPDQAEPVHFYVVNWVERTTQNKGQGPSDEYEVTGGRSIQGTITGSQKKAFDVRFPGKLKEFLFLVGD